MAMLIQYLSAKAGIATDLAEVLGGALALHLLFDLPLPTGGLITAGVASALLGLQSRGARPFEVAITGLRLVVLIGFLYNLLISDVDADAAAAGLVPYVAGTDTALLATGMLGATVMPHVIYLHGALTQDRYVRDTEAERLGLLRSQRVDVVAAMSLAGLINLAMLVVAAQALSNLPQPVDSIEGAHAGLAATLGPTAALLIALALLASGFAASGVETYSGQVVMQGFLRRRIPLVVRRPVTLAPALIVIAAGVDPTRALVISQVILSFGIPFDLIPLVMLTSRRDVMGGLVNRRHTTVVASVVAAVICLLNVTLICLTIAG